MNNETGLADYNINNERELLLRVAEGDQSAYRIMFNNYWPKIFANALKFTKSPEQAQDLGQEIFMKIWVNREKLRNIDRFDAYLFRVAQNAIFDFFNTKVLSLENEDFLSEYFEDSHPSPIERLEAKELEIVITQAIVHLPEQVRTAFQLSRKEGLSHAEISKKMGISQITSKSYISRAIISIKKHLAGRFVMFIIICAFHFLANNRWIIIFFEIIAFHHLVLLSL